MDKNIVVIAVFCVCMPHIAYSEDSDIDIAVVVEHLNENYFEDTPPYCGNLDVR